MARNQTLCRTAGLRGWSACATTAFFCRRQSKKAATAVSATTSTTRMIQAQNGMPSVDCGPGGGLAELSRMGPTTAVVVVVVEPKTAVVKLVVALVELAFAGLVGLTFVDLVGQLADENPAVFLTNSWPATREKSSSPLLWSRPIPILTVCCGDGHDRTDDCATVVELSTQVRDELANNTVHTDATDLSCSHCQNGPMAARTASARPLRMASGSQGHLLKEALGWPAAKPNAAWSPTETKTPSNLLLSKPSGALNAATRTPTCRISLNGAVLMLTLTWPCSARQPNTSVVATGFRALVQPTASQRTSRTSKTLSQPPPWSLLHSRRSPLML